MLAYLNRNMLEPELILIENQALINDAIWLDLLSPTKTEKNDVEQHIGREIPTRAEMVEIELSSRLYKENDVLFMTATMIAQSDSPTRRLDPVTFILTPDQLITLRYIEPQSFKLFNAKLKKLDSTHRDAMTLLIELLDVTIDRLADILERAGTSLDDYSKTIFRAPHQKKEKMNYEQLMQEIGANGDLNTKTRESLVTFNRLISFLLQTASSRMDSESQLRVASMSKDIVSLSDHANFLSGKINFLLDATLGMVNIEQNNIIKIFSVAAVIFLPPTLIASIYGMNFHTMPELSWKYGYTYAIGMIVFAAWLPYKFFKYKKWF